MHDVIGYKDALDNMRYVNLGTKVTSDVVTDSVLMTNSSSNTQCLEYYNNDTLDYVLTLPNSITADIDVSDTTTELLLTTNLFLFSRAPELEDAAKRRCAFVGSEDITINSRTVATRSNSIKSVLKDYYTCTHKVFVMFEEVGLMTGDIEDSSLDSSLPDCLPPQEGSSITVATPRSSSQWRLSTLSASSDCRQRSTTTGKLLIDGVVMYYDGGDLVPTSEAAESYVVADKSCQVDTNELTMDRDLVCKLSESKLSSLTFYCLSPSGSLSMPAASSPAAPTVPIAFGVNGTGSRLSISWTTDTGVAR